MRRIISGWLPPKKRISSRRARQCVAKRSAAGRALPGLEGQVGVDEVRLVEHGIALHGLADGACAGQGFGSRLRVRPFAGDLGLEERAEGLGKRDAVLRGIVAGLPDQAPGLRQVAGRRCRPRVEEAAVAGLEDSQPLPGQRVQVPKREERIRGVPQRQPAVDHLRQGVRSQTVGAMGLGHLGRPGREPHGLPAAVRVPCEDGPLRVQLHLRQRIAELQSLEAMQPAPRRGGPAPPELEVEERRARGHGDLGHRLLPGHALDTTPQLAEQGMPGEAEAEGPEGRAFEPPPRKGGQRLRRGEQILQGRDPAVHPQVRAPLPPEGLEDLRERQGLTRAVAVRTQRRERLLQVPPPVGRLDGHAAGAAPEPEPGMGTQGGLGDLPEPGVEGPVAPGAAEPRAVLAEQRVQGRPGLRLHEELGGLFGCALAGQVLARLDPPAHQLVPAAVGLEAPSQQLAQERVQPMGRPGAGQALHEAAALRPALKHAGGFCAPGQSLHELRGRARRQRRRHQHLALAGGRPVQDLAGQVVEDVPGSAGVPRAARLEVQDQATQPPLAALREGGDLVLREIRGAAAPGHLGDFLHGGFQLPRPHPSQPSFDARSRQRGGQWLAARQEEAAAGGHHGHQMGKDLPPQRGAGHLVEIVQDEVQRAHLREEPLEEGARERDQAARAVRTEAGQARAQAVAQPRGVVEERRRVGVPRVELDPPGRSGLPLGQVAGHERGLAAPGGRSDPHGRRRGVQQREQPRPGRDAPHLRRRELGEGRDGAGGRGRSPRRRLDGRRGLHGGHEAHPHASARLDEPLLRAAVAERLAHLLERAPQGGRAHGRPAPDLLQELLARHEAATVLDEVLEDARRRRA